MVTQFQTTMADIIEILKSSGNANIKFEITGEDLRNFADELINRAVNEVAMVIQEKNEQLINKEEAKRLLGVCDATLWHWERKKYLMPVKVGTRVRYRASDIKKILGERVTPFLPSSLNYETANN